MDGARLADAWTAFFAELETTYVALITISALFASRDCEATIKNLRSGVERFTQKPLNKTALEVLRDVYANSIILQGDGDACVVTLRCLGAVHAQAAEQTQQPLVPPSGRALMARRGYHQPPPSIGELPALIAAEKTKLRDAMTRYQKKRGANRPPPLLRPLSAAEKAAEKAAAASAAASSSAASSGAAVKVEEDDEAADDLPWSEGEAVDATNICSYLRAQEDYKDQIVHTAVTLPREGTKVSLADLLSQGTTPLCKPIEKALHAKGITSLFQHQSDALSATGDVIIATPTSSGKSLTYTIPAVRAVIDSPYARSLLLFPTKALAQDQLGSLTAFADSVFEHVGRGANQGILYAATLDGDTPQADRKQLARRAHVVLANPDILHAYVLPKHTEWREMLSNLKVIAIDEAHAYHGVFGTHVALVLRRLLRLCAKYGATPRVICCSATIANPKEHMANLTGIPYSNLTVVTEDGAPSGRRTLCLWNPPQLEPSKLIEWHEKLPPGAVKRRASSLNQASTLLSIMLTNGLRTIAFCRTRAVAERLFERAREKLPPSLRGKLACYRAGYLVEQRRETERKLFGGELLGVVATNALELGVDIGGLDCTIHLGYPGSTASLSQQSGRAGRGGRDSIAILIGSDNPMEQYLMAHPQALLTRPLERTVINPVNPIALKQHLLSAAYEAPLKLPQEGAAAAADDAAVAVEPEPCLGKWSEWRDAAQAGLSAGQLKERTRGQLDCVAGLTPHTGLSLRDIDTTRIRLIVIPPDGAYGTMPHAKEEEIESMEGDIAQLRVYEGAVYLHQGASYLVEELNLQQCVAKLRRKDLGYYTEPRDHTRVYILGRGTDPYDVFGCHSYAGPMRVSKSVYGYRMLNKATGKLMPYGLVEVEKPLPPMEYDTRGIWLDLPSALRDALHKRGEAYARGGLHALEHLAISLAPLCATCEPTDLGCQCTRRPGDEHGERFLLFERRRGGVGVADALPEGMPRLLQACQARLDECDCESGCLACVHMSGCGEYNEGLDKSAARTILKWLVQGEMPQECTACDDVVVAKEEDEVKVEEQQPASKRARTEPPGSAGGASSSSAVSTIDLVSEEDGEEEEEWEEAVMVS